MPPAARPGEVDLVTGAFGNTGAAIVERLRARGRGVRTLTNHAPAGPIDLDVRPLAFDDPARLRAAFDGVGTFYNTFWMRTGDGTGYGAAVARSQALIAAAAEAGVRRIVQLSVLNAGADSPYPYFRGKAAVEAALRGSRVPSAILRPAVIFGGENVLLENLAWLLRRLPVFTVPGDGTYRIRPVYLDDLAEACVDAGQRDGDELHDAVGSERPTFDELVRMVRSAVGARTRIVHAPARIVLGGSRLLSAVLRDPLLTREELASTMDGLADCDGAAIGTTSLAHWIAEHGEMLGRYRIATRGH